MKAQQQQIKRSQNNQILSQQLMKNTCQVLKKQQLQVYFKSVEISPYSDQKSDFYLNERFINITQQIYNGSTQINQNSQNINHLLVKQKINLEEQKSYQLKLKKAEILSQLSLLDSQLCKSKRSKTRSSRYDNNSQSLHISRDYSLEENEQQSRLDDSSVKKLKKMILSKNEHKQLMVKLSQQRSDRQKLKIILKQRQISKLKKSQQQQNLAQNMKKQEERVKKLNEIQQKLKRKRGEQDRLVELGRQSDRRVRQILSRKFLYQQIEQRFQRDKLPLLQEHKRKLQEKRDIANDYSIELINSHEKNYLESKDKEKVNKSMVKGSVFHAPQKSAKLAILLQQQKTQQRKRLVQKQLAIEQKLHRQQSYVTYLKQNFLVLKDKSRQQTKTEPKKEAEIDIKLLGFNYLQDNKKNSKKVHSQEASNKNIVSLQKKHRSPRNSRVLNKERHNNLLKHQQQSIQNLLHDDKTNENERIRRLKLETQKLSQALQIREQKLKQGYSERIQDEAVELLLTSIQAKIGIIGIKK